MRSAHTQGNWQTCWKPRRDETHQYDHSQCGMAPKRHYPALGTSPADAGTIGCDNGDLLQLTIRRGIANVTAEVSDMMSPGHISLPNGTGIQYTDKEGNHLCAGVAPKDLTDVASRDFLAGTP